MEVKSLTDLRKLIITASSASKILPEGVKVTVPAAAVPAVDVKLPIIVLVDTSSGYGIKSPKYYHSNTSERGRTR